MTYLYGDSTDSGLELNYIELLRDFLDVAVQILLSEHRIATAKRQAEEAERSGEAEKVELEGLHDSLRTLLESARLESSSTNLQQSVIALERSTADTLKRAGANIDAKVREARTQHATRREREHKGNTKLLAPLLLDHQLPDSENRIGLALDAEGKAYAATIKGSCRQGLGWRMSADIPSDSPYREAIKVGSLAPELSIRVPEKSGFVRKSIKLKPLRLSNYLVKSVEEVRNEVHISLRSTPVGDEAGLDIAISPTAPRIKLVRITKGDRSPTFEPEPDDERVLLSLCEDLGRDARALIEKRSQVLEILYGGKPLAQCDAPAELVRRLVDRIGPIIQEISKHSLDSNELVLKRVLAGDRREEIFASKADLRSKLNGLPVPLRRVFDSLSLGAFEDEAGDNEPTHQIDLDDIEESAASRAATEIEITAEIPDEEFEGPTAVKPVDQGDLAATANTIVSSANKPPQPPLPLLPKPPTLPSNRQPSPDSIDEALDALEEQG